MALAITKSQLFGVKNYDQALALMLVAQAEGLHPASAARDYDIINGRPAKKAEAMQRTFMESGGRLEWHRLDDECADATFSHPAGGQVRISWDMVRVRNAELGGKPMWKKYPRQMLRARCVSDGVRTVCPMATTGMYVPEEVRDFDNDPKPATVVVTQPATSTETKASGSSAASSTVLVGMAGKDIDAAEDEIVAGSVLRRSQLQKLSDMIEKSDGAWSAYQVEAYVAQVFGHDRPRKMSQAEYDDLISTMEKKSFHAASGSAFQIQE